MTTTTYFLFSSVMQKTLGCMCQLWLARAHRRTYPLRQGQPLPTKIYKLLDRTACLSLTNDNVESGHQDNLRQTKNNNFIDFWKYLLDILMLAGLFITVPFVIDWFFPHYSPLIILLKFHTFLTTTVDREDGYMVLQNYKRLD